MYCRCYEQLSTKYEIYAVDTLGMGLSSRPNFDKNTPEECINYFVNFIEQWRQKHNLEQIVIAGHSFGGYLASNYMVRYPKRVQKLFLISTIGVKKVTQEENLIHEKNLFWNSKGIKGKAYIIFMHYIWKFKILPMQVYHNFSALGNFLLKGYLQRRFKFQNQDKILWNDLFTHYAQLRISTEKSIYKMFYFPNLTPYISIEEQIKGREEIYKHIPIVFFYGDRDWVPQEGAIYLQKLNKLNIKLKIISNSGHQITMDNPQELCEEILRDY